MTSTQDWSWSATIPLFGNNGCGVSGCQFNRPGGCTDIFCCALNLSEALIAAGYALPAASAVNYCPHRRVRNADGMARVCNAQNGAPDSSTWANRPTWKGIVYFEGNLVADAESAKQDPESLAAATGHIDFWNGTKALHQQYPSATTVWFWKMGE